MSALEKFYVLDSLMLRLKGRAFLSYIYVTPVTNANLEITRERKYSRTHACMVCDLFPLS